MTRCPCCQPRGTNNTNVCKPDPYGHHYASACIRDVRSENGFGQAAQPHAIHDAIKRELKDIAVHAQSPCILEPQDLLFVQNSDNQVRPDMVMDIAVSNTTRMKHAIDVSIVCPFIGSKSGKIEIGSNTDNGMPKHDATANSKVSSKNAKYKTLCENRHITFVPFVMYSTGKIHKDGLKLLKNLAEQAESIREIPANILFKYYLKRINFVLIKQVSYTIRMKANASLQIGHGNENTVHYNMAVNNWRALEIASEPNNLMVFPELRRH